MFKKSLQKTDKINESKDVFIDKAVDKEAEAANEESTKKKTVLTGLTKQHFIILFLVVAITFGLGVKYGQLMAGADSTVTFLNNEKKIADDEITAFVSGAVLEEGIVKIKLGSTLGDLVTKVGLKDYAAKDLLNLSLVLVDKDVIYVPQKGEDLTAQNLDNNAYFGYNPNGIINYAENISQPDVSKSSKSSSGKTGTKHKVSQKKKTEKPEPKIININTANQKEFELLPGIGPKKAKAIITYRNTSGEFVVIEDIMKVSGIGPKTFEGFKQYLLVK